MRHEQAQEFTEALGQVFGGAVRLADVGQDMGIPDALGLSAEEWLQRRLVGDIRLSISERRQVVAELTERGMTVRDIGEKLGVGHATVNRDQRAAVSSETPTTEDPAPRREPELPLVSDETPEPEVIEPEPEPAPNPEPEPDRDDPEPDLDPAAGGRDRTVMFTSETAEWETPQDFFDALDAEFHFDLDVCASPGLEKVAHFFSPEDDGLAQDWTGVCWMNPPYGPGIGKWVEKAHESADAGATVVCLVPARVDTSWFWRHCRQGEVRFLRGRLKFGGGDSSAPFPSCIVVLGPDVESRVVWWER